MNRSNSVASARMAKMKMAAKDRSVSPEVTGRLDQLSAERLDDLGEALLDFTSLADLEAWFARHQSN